MKLYPAYKDSGIEWLGKIPKHWEIKKLKYLFSLSNGESAQNERSGDYLLYGANGVIGNYEKANIFDEKIVIGRVGASGEINVAQKNSWVSDNALIVDLFTNIHFKFIFYLLKSINFPNQINKTAQPLITGAFIGNYPACIPEYAEQIAIATYLDRKTSQIDDLISKKERMVELLKEERTAIINQAVTKGLDPNVEIKDSGIDWLGKIPKHWEIKKLKYIARVNNMALSETTDENYEFNYIDISNVSLEEGFTLGEKFNFANAPSRARRIVRKGDTIVSTVRIYLKAITYFGNDVNDIIVSTGFAVISPHKNFAPKFLYYILRSEKFIDRVCALSVGVNYPAINSTDLSDIIIWYPDNKNEQEKIAKYLDSIVMKTNDAIKRLQTEISYLQEYRTALISEVVTGKIDVRNCFINTEGVSNAT